MSDMMSNAQPLPTEELLSIAEFAAAIGKTERQVYRYIKQARVRTVEASQTGMAGVRIPASETDRFQQPVVVTKVLQIQPEPQATGLDIMSDERMSQAQTVPLERHEAALMRMGFLERELEQSRKMLTDGGAEVAELKQNLQATHDDRVGIQVRAELEQQARERAEQRVEELVAQLAVAEEKLRRPWWKLW